LKQRLQDSTKLVSFLFFNWRDFAKNRHCNFKFRQISDFGGFQLAPTVSGRKRLKKPPGLLLYNFGFHCVTSQKYKGGLMIWMNFFWFIARF
jgi:hypothetical protein